MTWRDLLLAFVAGWALRPYARAIHRRRRQGRSVVDAVTDKTGRDKRRTPRVTEVP